MTLSRYILARFAQMFGIHRKTRRMSEAVTETHLLRESEAVLGSKIWEKVESINALSMEYWNLRKLEKERNEICIQFEACQECLKKAHKERSLLLNQAPNEDKERQAERVVLIKNVEQYSHKNDHLSMGTQELRRSHSCLKAKLEVLNNEETPDLREIKNVRQQLLEIKESFIDLQAQRAKIANIIQAGRTRIEEIDQELKEAQQSRRAQASGTFHIIAEGNKEVSVFKAEISAIDAKMYLLYAEVGRYVSRQAPDNQACRKASSSEPGLIHIMRKLRRSIELNKQLIGNR